MQVTSDLIFLGVQELKSKKGDEFSLACFLDENEFTVIKPFADSNIINDLGKIKQFQKVNMTLNINSNNGRTYYRIDRINAE